MRNPSDLQGENERQRKKKKKRRQEHVRQSLHKGDVTREDLQRRCLAQHILAMLEKCCNYSKQCRNNVATLCCAKNRRCESSGVTSPSTRTGRATTIFSASQHYNIVVTLFRIAAILFQQLKPVLR